MVMGKERESGIEKRIEIVLNLGNYESIRVTAGFSEKVTWSTAEERQEKSKKIHELLLKEVKRDIDRMSNDLGLRQNLIDYSNAFEAIKGVKTPDKEALDAVSDDGDFDIE